MAPMRKLSYVHEITIASTSCKVTWELGGSDVKI